MKSGDIPISKLKSNKASGIDEIENESLKNLPNTVFDGITSLFNIILNTGLVPTDWGIRVIKPLYKNKGSPNDLDNYRGITLISCVGKLFTVVVNGRLTSYLESTGTMGDKQAGFGAGRSTSLVSFQVENPVGILQSLRGVGE